MEHVAILDFGSQYTHLISRNIRELGVLSKIYPHNASARELKKNKAVGIILSGGPQSVYDKEAISVDPEIFNLPPHHKTLCKSSDNKKTKKWCGGLGIPILGLCYGHQLAAHLLGGRVKPGKIREYGSANLEITGKTKIFSGIRKKTSVWMSHGDSVQKIPAGFSVIGKTANCPVTAMADEKRKIYGFQFHPEVMHTKEGAKMLENFISLCQVKRNWKVGNLIENLIFKIRKQAGKKKVLVLVSGGVDSSVAFALLTKALGKKRVLGLYIDTGFMRQGESEEILAGFKKIGFDNIKSIEAGKIFFKNLSGVADPEEKRKIIGQTFLDVKDKIGKEFNLNEKEWMLGQGTIYPDTIESGATKNADKIKTHHNRVDAIQKLIEKGLVIEPLVDFYKDEVRALGKLLKLPEKLINRHPFPGPGLAIMTLCHSVQTCKNNIVSLNKDVSNFYKKNYPDIKYKILSVKSVGVQGDNRTYAHPLVIWGEKNWEKLHQISSGTTNAIKGINRVIFLLNYNKGNKFNYKLPNKDLYLTPDRINVTQLANSIVYKNIEKAGIYNEIWEFPVVQIPIMNQKKQESIVLRPFNSRDVMTLKFYRMNKKILNKIVKELLATRKVAYVFFDITDKPPGTVQWE